MERNNKMKDRFMKKIFSIILILSVCLLTACGKKKDSVETYSTEEITSGAQAAGNKAVGASQTIAILAKDAPNSDNADKISSEAALLVDATANKIIFNKNAHKTEAPASTTKILTALVALKYADQKATRKIGDEVIIDEDNIVMCDYRIGDDVPFDVLLHGALMKSGNDAAAALALFTSPTMDDFIAKMNEEAKRIGATNSHFMNPHGLDQDNHYTTAYDLYLMFNEAIKNPQFIEALGCKEYNSTFNRSTDYGDYIIECSYSNGNAYVNGSKKAPSYVNVIGGKAGYTDNAQRCYVMLAELGGHKYIFVTMKCATRDIMYDDLSYLLTLVPDMNAN